MYMAIVKSEGGRVAKFQEYETEAECQEHVDRVKDAFPSAFVYNNAAGATLRDLWVDAGTVTIVPIIEPPPSYRELRGAAYAAELGDTPGIMSAISDTLDAVIDATQAALDAAGAPAPAKFAEKKAKRDEIKARHPKP